MRSWFRELDELLRGRRTAASDLAEGRLQLPLQRFVVLALFLGAGYGFFMGWFAVLNRDPRVWMQLLASTLKLPALFLLTLVVTFPSLYVFNALVGCRLTWGTTLRLLVGAVAVNLAVAASLGPILGFFTFSTDSYPFMILLNVVLLGLAGLVGLSFLLGVLRRTAKWQAFAPPPEPPPEPGPVEPGSASYLLSGEFGASVPPRPRPSPPNEPEALGQAHGIFRIWVVIFGLVGAQMGWLLRPFIGHPGTPFEWFRHRSGNFFQAMGHVFDSLMK